MRRLLWWVNGALALATALALLSPYAAPGHLWPIAFAGLAFPSLVIAHLLALGWWLLREVRRAWLSALCLAASVPGINALVGFGESPTAPAERTLTLVNYNLLGGAEFDVADPDAFRQNVDAFAACVLPGADLVAFQETPRYERVRRALEARLDSAGLTHHFYPGEVNVSLHARVPFRETSVLEEGNTTNAIITALIVPQPGDTLRVFGAHLQSNSIRIDAERVAKDVARGRRRAYWKLRGVAANYRTAARERARQAAILTRAIRASDHPVVVLGDLNDVPQSYAVSELLRAGLSDSFRESGRGLGVSYPGTIPGLRIDYLLASEGLPWYGSEVLDCDFSDHKPVRAVLGLGKGGNGDGGDTMGDDGGDGDDRDGG